MSVDHCFKQPCVIFVKRLLPKLKIKKNKKTIINIKLNIFFRLNTGHYPCCGEKAFRFELVKHPVVRYVYEIIQLFTN